MGVNKVNKCNINSSVATLVDNRKWGVATDSDIIKSIIENYSTYLNCPTVPIDTCYPDTCNNQPIVVVCAITIYGITAIQNLPLITFIPWFDNPSTTHNTFEWSYDTHIYDFVSDDGKGTLVLRVKPGIDMSETTARVSVTITDENLCTATMTCYLVGGVSACDPYVPCSNIGNLVVTLNTD